MRTFLFSMSAPNKKQGYYIHCIAGYSGKSSLSKKHPALVTSRQVLRQVSLMKNDIHC